MKPVDKQALTPRYEQVHDALLALIRSGALAVGEKLPADVEVAHRFDVSKVTAHRALQALASGGWVTRAVGRGTFVAERPLPTALRRVALAFGASAANILGSDYYGGIYRGIADAMGEGAELILLPDAFASVAPRLSEALDGVLILAPRENALAAVRALARESRPVVLVGAHWPHADVAAVDSDNAAAAGSVVEHLSAQGHRKIVLLYAEPETANTRDRIAGFRAAVGRLGLTGIEMQAKQFFRLSAEEKTALAAATAGNGPATAVFAAGYFLALDAMNALREAGLSVPEDISVAGFDDPVAARLGHPSLTTVRQPLYDMGRRAAERLRGLAESQQSGGIELLPAELIVRSSTAPRKGFHP